MGGPLYVAAFAVGTTLLLLLLAELGQRGLGADLKGGNDAQRLAAVGEVLGVFLIAGAAVRDGVQGERLLPDVIACAAYGAVGLAASTFAGHLGVRTLLGTSLHDEVGRGNKAAGLAAAGQMLASAIVTSRTITGSELHDLGLALVFFVIGQGTLLVFVLLFRALTTYDDAEQVHGENLAAAVSYAGVAVAIAIVVARAVQGEDEDQFEGWLTSLRGYGGVLLGILAFYPVRQLFVQTLLMRTPLHLRGGALDVAIAQNRSSGLATLEAASYVATAIVIAQLA
jgi:uncharacterized membrane protein YjfL (UPF0719 family)